MNPVLLIRHGSGEEQEVRLDKDGVSVGRSTVNTVPSPQDTSMSRRHLVIESQDGAWCLRDLNSKNGTVVNGFEVTDTVALEPGDTIQAGKLTIVFDPPDDKKKTDSGIDVRPLLEDDTVETSLEQLLNVRRVRTQGVQRGWKTPLDAFLRAGAELAQGHSLEKLFEVILALAVEAASAERGMLLVKESNGELRDRARQGSGITVSQAVREKVMQRGQSVLVSNVLQDGTFGSRDSIAAQALRTLMAVPLQTDSEVIGMIYVDSANPSRRFSSEDLHLLTAFAWVAALRVHRQRLAEREQEQKVLAREIEQAASIQRRVLPRAAPTLPGLEVDGYNKACRTVGGDYYDYWERPDGRLGLLVSDISGKGMPAALMMMSLQARIRILSEEHRPPHEMAERLNRIMVEDGHTNRFATFFSAAVSPDGSMSYCNAGHNPPLLLRGSGEAEWLSGGGPVLGLLPAARYRSVEVDLQPNDSLILFSDGVTEAFNEQGQEFGPERLLDVASRCDRSSASCILSSVRAAVEDWIGGTPLDDDLTLVVAVRTLAAE